MNTGSFLEAAAVFDTARTRRSLPEAVRLIDPRGAALHAGVGRRAREARGVN
jgi:hypothetical protein